MTLSQERHHTIAAATAAAVAAVACCHGVRMLRTSSVDARCGADDGNNSRRAVVVLAGGRQLPQPCASREQPYAYAACDGIGELHQGYPYEHTGSCTPHEGSPRTDERMCVALAAGTLVWVSQSKKKGGADSAGDLFSRAAIVKDPFAAAPGSAAYAGAAGGSGKRRVTVRYPQGSTYSARRRMLAPILPRPAQRCVIVAPDTACYRRLCRIHTLPTDRFLEIGCDFGACTVGAAESLVAAVPGEPEPLRHHAVAFGVDKSRDSIAEAKRRHSATTATATRGAAVVFEEADALSVRRCPPPAAVLGLGCALLSVEKI